MNLLLRRQVTLCYTRFSQLTGFLIVNHWAGPTEQSLLGVWSLHSLHECHCFDANWIVNRLGTSEELLLTLLIEDGLLSGCCYRGEWKSVLFFNKSFFGRLSNNFPWTQWKESRNSKSSTLHLEFSFDLIHRCIPIRWHFEWLENVDVGVGMWVQLALL